MPITLPDPPYDLNALEPHMSRKTLCFHHAKHHQGYVDTTNELIEGTALAGESLESIIRKAADDGDGELFNNAAQVWNHTFFWNSMIPGGSAPEGAIADRVEQAFGDLDGFKKAFVEAATGRFGSGWAWLVARDGTLEITTTRNAETPLVSSAAPLLACDVWEHAYYLDYQNERAAFVEAFLDNLVNWDFAAEQLAEAESDTQRSAA